MNRNASYQSLMYQFQDFVSFYKNLYFEIDQLTHTQRFVLIFLVFILLYWIFKYFFSKIYSRISFYNKDFQLYPTLSSQDEDFPNNAFLYNENSDKIPSSYLTISNNGFHSYSFFIYVNSLNYVKTITNPYALKNDIPSYVFVRGQYIQDSLKPNYIFNNMTPGVMLDTSTNKIKFVYSNQVKSLPGIEIDIDISLDTWVHFGIVCQNGKSITIYKNGKIQFLTTMDQFTMANEQLNDLYLFPTLKDQNQNQITQGFYGSLGLFLYHDGVYTPSEMNKIYESQKKIIDDWNKNKILKLMK